MRTDPQNTSWSLVPQRATTRTKSEISYIFNAFIDVHTPFVPDLKCRDSTYPCRGISFSIIIFARRRSNATHISGDFIRADMDPALIIDDDRTLTGAINQNQIVFLVGLLHLSPLGHLLPFDARFFKAATCPFALCGCCRRCNIPICVFPCFSGVDNALSWNL